MAYYRALLEHGYGIDQVPILVCKETAKTANIKRTKQAKIMKIPGTYLMYRLFVKSVMKKNFPQEGWDTQWMRCDSREIHFDLTRCIYKEVCDAEGHPELCAVFCENDDIVFSGLMPKIRFERSGTLGKGSDRCDFHFIKNK